MKKLSAKTARVRDSYVARTGMNTRACKILIAAHQVKIEFVEDEDGNSIRVWKSSESSSYSNADLKACLSNRVAVEANEMLGTVPPSAIKYCVTKGWLIPHGSLYRVTLKAALELDLPMRFKGLHNGRKIPFAPAPSKKA
jgi:hypothetical protein